MKKLLFFSLVGLCCVLGIRNLQAQSLAASSNTVFYFPHFADGGPSESRWITVFRFVNPLAVENLPVSGNLAFFDPQGNPVPLDFGNGPVTTLHLTISAKGSIELKTTGSSAILRTGSVWASFDSRVIAAEEFQDWHNGVFANGASVNASPATYGSETYGDRNTGIAIANPTLSTMYCSGGFLDANGYDLGANSIVVPARGQVSFTLGNAINTGYSGSGSYNLACFSQPNAPFGSPLAPFAVLAIAGNSQGITSSMPTGDFALPSNSFQLIWNSFYSLVKALNNTPGFQVGQPRLIVAGDTGPNGINAFFSCTSNSLTFELGLAELLADSPSEIAFVVAHELGHAHQCITGSTLAGVPVSNSNKENDADQFSFWGLLLTGYDAYAGGGALGKLAMASGQTGVLSQLFDDFTVAWGLGSDPHAAFTTRIGLIMSEIQSVCSSPQGAPLCQLEHSIFHPFLAAPLRVQEPEKAAN